MEADGTLNSPFPEYSIEWGWPMAEIQASFGDLWDKVCAIWHGLMGWIRVIIDWAKGIPGWVAGKVYNIYQWFIDKWLWLRKEVGDRFVQLIGHFKDWVKGVPGWVGGTLHNIWKWIQDKFTWLWAELRPMFQRVIGAWKDWDRGVPGWIKDRVYNVWAWITDKFTWVSERLRVARDWLRDRVDAARDWLRDHIIDRFKAFLGKAKNWVAGVPGWVTARCHSIWSWLVDKYHWLRDRVNEARDWLRDHIIDRFKAFLGKAKDWVAGVPGWVTDRVHSIWGWLVDKFRWVRDRITDAREWFGDKIIDPWTDWISEVWKWIKTSLGNIWTQLKTFLKNIWTTFVKNIAKPLYEGIVGVFEWVKQKFLDVITAFTDAIETMETAFSPIEPDQAWPVFRQWMTYCAAGIGAIGLINLGISVLHPTHTMGVGHISRVIYQFTNMSRVTGIFVGAILGAQLKLPAEYYFNKVFRPRIPTWAELQGMARKHELTRAQFEEAMKYHGFSDDWIEHIYYYMWADPRLYDILRLADVATPEGLPTDPELIERLSRMGIDPTDPDWWLTMKFMLAGYEDVDVGALTQVVHKRETLEERGRYITQVRSMYHWGYWDREKTLEALVAGGLNPRQISYVLQAEDLWFDREVLDDKVLTWREKFRRGQITAEELESALEPLIPRGRRRTAIVALEKIRKVPRPPVVRPKPPEPLYKQPAGKKRVTAAITLYRGELIDDDELLRRLLAQEMPTPEANATLALERARLRVRPVPKPPEEPPFYETPEGRIRVHTLRTLYRGRLLDDKELVTGLMNLEMAQTFARAVLADEQAWLVLHPEPPPPPVPPLYRTDEGREKLRLYKLQFRTGVIDSEKLGDFLLDLEMSAETAGAIVDYEVLRKIAAAPPPAPPPPPLYKTDEGRARLRLYVEQFRRDEITKRVFYLRLLAIEMTEAQAQAIADYEELRKE